MFLACHFSKIYLHSEKKTWFYLDQNVRYLISSILIHKKEVLLERSCSNFSIFLKSTCFLFVIFAKFIFSQKENCGFIWPKTFDFLFQIKSNIHSEKKSCSLKVAVLEFQKYEKTTLKFSKIFEK